MSAGSVIAALLSPNEVAPRQIGCRCLQKRECRKQILDLLSLFRRRVAEHLESDRLADSGIGIKYPCLDERFERYTAALHLL